MKKALLILFFITSTVAAVAQTSPVMPELAKYPWTDKELLAPEALAANLKEGAKAPLILNIGVVEDIKGSRHIGAASKTENIDKLKAEVAKLPKSAEVIIYCGCCPFTRCPNAQPAFNTLKKMGFTNVKLLNLPENLKTNWIAKGFPLAK
jgi:hypothetical protein